MIPENGEKKGMVLGVSPNWIGMLLGVSLFLIFSYGISKLKGHGFIPNALEMPLFVAPMISCGVAYAVFFDAYRHINTLNFNILNLVCALVVTFLCAFLSMVHGWYGHLLIMGIMFLVFICWDIYVVKISGASDEYKHEVRTAHKSINLPTLGTLICLALLLSYLEWSGFSADIEDISGHPVNVLDLVTTGAVAFHLGVASLAYVCAVTSLGTVLLRENKF